MQGTEGGSSESPAWDSQAGGRAPLENVTAVERSASLAGHFLKLPVFPHCNMFAGNGKAIVLLISLPCNSPAFLVIKATANSLLLLENSYCPFTLSKPSLTLVPLYSRIHMEHSPVEIQCQPTCHFKWSRYRILKKSQVNLISIIHFI